MLVTNEDRAAPMEQVAGATGRLLGAVLS